MSVFQAGERIVLLRRQRGRERDPPQHRGGQGHGQVVAGHLRERAPIPDADAHALASMRHGHDLGLQLQPGSQRRGQRGGQPIVAALDAVHPAGSDVVVWRELVDERNQ